MPNQSDPNQNSATPPLTTQPAAPTPFPQSDLPPLPPDFQNVGSDVTTTPPVNKPVGSAAPPEQPPIISSSPKKKFGGGRIIATILGILLLVGGIGAGIYLTQQRQLFQQKAYTQTWGGANDTCNLIKISAVENSGYCNPLGSVSDGFSGTNDFGSTYSTTYTLTNLTAQTHEVAYTKLTFYCPTWAYGQEGQYAGSCVLNPISVSGTVTLQASQSANFLAERTGLLVQTNRNGLKSCGTYQTDFWITSVDGNPNCKHGNTPPLGEPAAFGVCRTGRVCQSVYTPPPTPTAPPSPTPTASPTTPPTSPPTAQCLGVKAYSATVTLQTSPVQWAPLTNAELSALKTGDSVYFCVAGSASSGSFDKGQFKINTTVEPETTTKRPGSNDFCQKYTIQSTDKTVLVLARIHHAVLNKWFGETF